MHTIARLLAAFELSHLPLSSPVQYFAELMPKGVAFFPFLFSFHTCQLCRACR